jgi:ABC-type Mn2+/Zn2+ transport system permease subunit
MCQKLLTLLCFMHMITKVRSDQLLSLMLRFGLAFTFAYAGIDAIREPEVWSAFLPPIAFKYAPMKLVLDGFSVSQLILAAALLWKKSAFFAAAASAATLAGITISSLVMDPNSMLIVFRDIGLFFASVGLMFAEVPKKLLRKG